MARNVFISFLGTGNYVETIYQFPNGSKSAPVRFIQEALILDICKNWTKNDKIYIFCTKGSKSANWGNNGHQKVSSEIEKIGLEQRLKENFHLSEIVEMVQIDEGFSEGEIWNIFDVVYEKIKENDTIYFDVTHAFRSIPLFSTTLFDFAHFMKSSNVVSIQYGAFEKLGPARDVKNMPVEERIAPIIDLTNVVRLQQYTDMAYAFLSYGKTKELGELLMKDENKNIKKIGRALTDFENSLKSNNLDSLKKGKWIKDIRGNIGFLEKSDTPVPIKKLMATIKGAFKDFEAEESNRNIELAIDWAIKYEMIVQAYTLGLEYIISLLADKLSDYNNYDYERDFRTFVSNLFGVKDYVLKDPENKLEGRLADDIDLTMRLVNLDWVQRIRKHYSDFSSVRNTLNHANKGSNYEDVMKKFKLNFYTLLDAVKNC